MVQKAGPFRSGQADNGGSANKDTNRPISGRVVGVFAEAVAGCLSTISLSLTMKDPDQDIVVDASLNAPQWWYPVTVQNLNTTGAAIANQYSLGVPIDGVLNVAISGAEEGDEVAVTLLLE